MVAAHKVPTLRVCTVVTLCVRKVLTLRVLNLMTLCALKVVPLHIRSSDTRYWMHTRNIWVESVSGSHTPLLAPTRTRDQRGRLAETAGQLVCVITSVSAHQANRA